MTTHQCAFVYDDGTREEFVIHDPVGGWCPVTVGGSALKEWGLDAGGHIQSATGRTVGSALANLVEATYPRRRISEVHAPTDVMARALEHAARLPSSFMGYGVPDPVHNYFPNIRQVPTDGDSP